MLGNEHCFVGRVGQDPSVKFFESGTVVANCNIAVNRPTKDDQPDWVPLVFWGKTAEVVANYVRKGSLIGITGMLKFEHWTDRSTGAARSKPVIEVSKLDLFGKPPSESGSQYADDEF